LIRLTDITLSCLDVYDPTGEQLSQLCGLLLNIGADYTELSVKAFRKMGALPPGGRYILRCESIMQAREYPQFGTYVCHRTGRCAPAGLISEIQVNDIREIPLLNRYGSLQSVRIRGLDDVLSHDYKPAFHALRQSFPGRVQLCPENRYHCATAIAVEWLLDGGNEAAASFAGIGGYAAIEEVLMALRLEIRRKPNFDFSILPGIKALIEEITKEPVPARKPVIGEDIFLVEAGIHVDGIIKNPKIYEPYQPELVGNARRLVLGKHSGKASVRLKMKELSLPEASADVAKLLSEVRRESIRLQRSLTDSEFLSLYKAVSQNFDGGGDDT